MNYQFSFEFKTKLVNLKIHFFPGMASVKDVNIIDVKRRIVPDKHYVYLLSVNYSDSTVAIIRRRYNQFFNFQSALLDKFPIEGCRKKSQGRIIPFLPGKILFGRSHVKKVALQRITPLEEYCKAIISLPAHISQCELVFNFFRPSKDEIHSALLNKNASVSSVSTISAPYLPDQLKVSSDYQARSKRELNVEKGMTVEVIEKNSSGWWLVRLDDQVGWVPSTYLERQKCETNSKTKLSENFYVSFESYVAKNRDELSFLRGMVLEILSKNENGWWLARCKEKQGLVPAVYLEKCKNVKHNQLENKLHEKFGNGRCGTRNQQRYVTLANFKPESPGYVQFNTGSRVKVLNEDPSGWSYISVAGKTGWAPSTYLRIISESASDETS
uniref:SH3 and PX domain-containing protein 2A n=1 Tax=Strigamia maritima TaxID=126957 RepID=T1JFN5_STRMM